MGFLNRMLLFSICTLGITAALVSAAEMPVSHLYFQQEGEDFLVPDVALHDLEEVVEKPNTNQSVPLKSCKKEVSEEATGDLDDPLELEMDMQDMDLIADPLEPLNRVFFHFNDKLYFWFLKPISTGYGKVVPEVLRVSIRNFFENLSMPIRAVNCILQGDIKGFGTELSRFVVNSTLGVAGFGNPAKQLFGMDMQDEDLGQTFGLYGLGPAFYINWPVLGPSSVRDTIGLVGDSFLSPMYYAVDATKYKIAIKGYEMVNRTSLKIGDYESLKKAALDPYISLRDAYHQHRQHKIKE
ncbi:MAG: VacJ family lipoprotein [Deltaproteobacteria bacterium]|nr:VacJ family lipoprotein [Deltaproteobacteria bacterium]MBW1908733.1 VacJ family lipoprotein [Deltaproteobacteria bacterium]MBW2114662.1 VacJ family lipoprotein [Deltaproteobacteria bacterium]MBW2168511.1 VacJ family lipoprotein [Deltaproteobacteria bacterium]MBW2357513.1 VacJ family lipoprotein [Deltaproteobacteria bacterium]